MITKTKYMTFIFALIMGVSLSAADELNEVRAEDIPMKIGRCTRAVVTDAARSPLAYIGTGAVATAAYMYKDNPTALTALGILSAGYHACVLPQWWRLGTELNYLKINDAAGSLLTRKIWGGQENLDTGYAITQHYNGLITDADKKCFAKQLEKEIGRGNTFQLALIVLENNLIRYEKSSSLLLKLAWAAGFNKANPEINFLKGSYLVNTNIDAKLRDTVDENISGSVISQSFTVRWRWSSFLGAAVPSWYTWSYTKASECIWETVHQYARIRAIHKILETHIPESNTLTVILRPDVQGMRAETRGLGAPVIEEVN
jgi:hypothetical protein